VSASESMSAPAGNVMRTLLFLAHEETGMVAAQHSPSLTELACATGLGRSTVARCLNELESGGWLRRHRPPPYDAWANKDRTVYTLLCPAGTEV
jgi:DNA-binding MarR family transcriptional regulator